MRRPGFLAGTDYWFGNVDGLGKWNPTRWAKGAVKTVGRGAARSAVRSTKGAVRGAVRDVARASRAVVKDTRRSTKPRNVRAWWRRRRPF